MQTSVTGPGYDSSMLRMLIVALAYTKWQRVPRLSFSAHLHTLRQVTSSRNFCKQHLA